MSSNTQKVEVFQPRDAGQFYDFDNDEAEDEEMFNTLRDLTGGFVEVEDVTVEMFGRCYNLVGAEEVEVEDAAGDDEKNALNAVWQSWQNNDGLTEDSEMFREANDQERATSLSTGDIVRVEGTAYLCESIGWSEVPEVSF